jgi:hypothetical protein
MPKNDHDKRRSGGVQVADAPPPAPAADAQPESLDKVRDILFGGQMRAVDSRLQGLEERLRSDHEALRADFVKQRLSSERAKRTEELKSLAAEIKDTIRALEKRHVKLEEATNLADAGLRDQLLLQAERASTELNRLGEKLTAELKRSHQELKTTKPDSAALSGLLSELAARVGSLAAPPAKNGQRG